MLRDPGVQGVTEGKMDPRHDKRKIREAAREWREDRRAAAGRERNATFLAEVEGSLCAASIAGNPEPDLCLLSLARDYLAKGLQASPRMREIVGLVLDLKGAEPGEEREALLEMLEGAVGLLPRTGRSFAYSLLERRDGFLSFSNSDREWGAVEDLLNQALGRGAYAFRC